jgi:hypothetical protein
MRQRQYFEPFIGELILRPLDGTRMEIMQDFYFKDKADRLWKAPKGYQTDGASIPRALWTIVGSPYTGKYLKAAVIHDVYCELRSRESKLVHKTFYDGMIAAGVENMQAKVMYYAVLRFGPRWVVDRQLSCPLGHVCFSHTPTRITATAMPELDTEELIATKKEIEARNTPMEELSIMALERIGKKERIFVTGEQTDLLNGGTRKIADWYDATAGYGYIMFFE